MQNSSKRCVIRSITCALVMTSGVGSLTADESSKKEPGLKVVETADGFVVSEGDATVLQYQLSPKSLNGTFTRSNYIHPLCDLNGNEVTEDFPEDHRHHRGIFWAWHQVWVGDQKIGDPWLCKNFNWVTKARGLNYNSDNSVSVSATIEWQSDQLQDSDGLASPIAEELVRVTVHPRTNEYRIVEFRLAFRALLPDVRIGGSEDEKGYGGFSPRIKLNRNQTFVSEGKEIEPVKNAIHAGPWVDISDDKSGVAILTHPANPGAPEAWILRRSRSMQNARFPGAEPIPLPTDTCLLQRYQLVIHKGQSASVPLDALHRHFAESNR